MDISFLILSSLASLTSYVLVDYVWKIFFHRRLGVRKERSVSYTERLGELTSNLTKASREVDRILKELAEVSHDRATAVAHLEGEINALQKRQAELTEKVESLQGLPLPVADHFAALVGKEERKSARRDYILFGAGVLATTVIAIALKVFGWG